MRKAIFGKGQDVIRGPYHVLGIFALIVRKPSETREFRPADG